MQFLKKSVRGLSKFFFIILIFNLAVVAALVMTFNSPKKIEKSLSDSGVYSTFVSSALKEVQKSNDNGSTKSDDNIPIDNPDIVAAANKAFTPQLLQTTTENVLNGTYDWLSGKTQTPSFVIDLTQAKQTFAQAVGEAAKKRMASLPVCTTKQLKALGANADIDAFSVTCRPPGINLAQQQQKVTQDLATNKEFLGTPRLTPQNLPKDENGKTIFDNAAQAPKAYQFFNASPWLLAFLALLAGLIAFFLSETKRRGLRSLAIIFTVVGALLTFTNIGTTQAFNKLTQPSGKLGEAITGSFQQTTIKGLQSISHSVEPVILWFGIAYLVIGVGTLIALKFIKSKDQPSTGRGKEDKKGPTPPTDDSPKQETPKPADKPAPKPKSVQG